MPCAASRAAAPAGGQAGGREGKGVGSPSDSRQLAAVSAPGALTIPTRQPHTSCSSCSSVRQRKAMWRKICGQPCSSWHAAAHAQASPRLGTDPHLRRLRHRPRPFAQQLLAVWRQPGERQTVRHHRRGGPACLPTPDGSFCALATAWGPAPCRTAAVAAAAGGRWRQQQGLAAVSAVCWVRSAAYAVSAHAGRQWRVRADFAGGWAPPQRPSSSPMACCFAHRATRQLRAGLWAFKPHKGFQARTSPGLCELWRPQPS